MTIHCIAFLLCCLALLSSVLALYEAGLDRGLYVLTEENFNRTVYQNTGGQPAMTTASRYWLIQFYNSWCGHCIKYSQIYKAFGIKVQHWKDHLRIGTVDCSDHFNRDLCSRFAVHHTPVLRLFAPFSNQTHRGTDVEVGRSSVDLMESLLDVMEQTRQPEELLPLSQQSADQLWTTLPVTVNELAIIIEPIGSYVGKECIMHLLPNLHVIAIRRTFNNNLPLLRSLHVEAQQSSSFVVFLDRRHRDQRGVTPLESLSSHTDPVEAFTDAILRADTELTNRLHITRRPKIGPIYGDPSLQIQAPEHHQMHNEPQPTAPVPTSVHRVDLNSAIIYSLSNEIGQLDDITGLEYDALKNFIRAAIKWLPVEPATQRALRSIESNLQRRTYVTGSEIVRLLRENQIDTTDGAMEWLNCRGSVPDRRGYPCGLWQIFHTVSVRASEENASANSLAAEGVLTAVISYVQYFFSCGECSRNFMRGVYSLKGGHVVVSNAEAVMYLWRAHNEANRVLAGDYSEDPLYPKQQFPTLVQCFDCRKSTDPHATVIAWNESNVLRFLKNFYGLQSATTRGPSWTMTDGHGRRRRCLAGAC